MSDEFVYSCPCCQIGNCQPGKGTYLRMVGGALVSITDVPLWLCDICGCQEFDEEAVKQIETLLGVQEPDRGSAKIQPTAAVRRAKP